VADNSRMTPKDIIIDAIEEDVGGGFAFEDEEREVLKGLRQADLFMLQKAVIRVKRSVIEEREKA